MGCFSWICADDDEPMVQGDEAWLLVPPKFEDKYGKAIHIPSYGGYGDVGEDAEYDCYDLLAEWNRDRLQDGMLMLKPAREDFGSYSDAEELWMSNVKNWYLSRERMRDYQTGLPDEEMEEKYGKYWQREIGIDIGCYDYQMAKLPYQLKFVHRLLRCYDSYDFSPGDPNQGFGNWNDDEDDWDEEDE